MDHADRRPRRLVLIGTVASLALLCGSFAFVQNRADTAWRELQRSRDALRSATRLRTEPRAPLWGPATEGDAFAHYADAATAAMALGEQQRTPWLGLFGKDDAAVAAATAALRRAWQPILAALSAGAHARRADGPPEPDAESTTRNLLAYRDVCNLAAFEAKILRHEGRGREAVQTTLDALTLAGDLIRGGVLIDQMMGVALLAIGVEAWPDAALARLDRDSLTLFADGLTALDERLPEQIRMDRELLFVANLLLQATSHDDWGGGSAWRFGFSTRWMVADAFLAVAATWERMAGSAAPWPDRRQQLEREGEILTRSSNPLTAAMLPNLVAGERNLRESLATVRLLRMAVDVHRGLDREPLDDPLGAGPFARDAGDGTVTWSSAGAAKRMALRRTAAR